jgi:biotin synthase
VVNANAYELFKGGLQEKRVELLLSCAEKYPGKISTHLICGLGESEKEILSMINCFVSLGITVGLFAFTPLKGTDLEKWASPLPGAYRRVQIGHYLLNRNIAAFNDFLFNDEKLISCGLTENNLKKSLADGWAFRTSGCPDCNRPYYNEHPGGELYNYHYPPGKEAIAAALHQSELLNKCSLSEPIRGVKK